MSERETPEQVEVECLSCNRIVSAPVLSRVLPDYEIDRSRYDIDGRNSCTAYKVAYCPRCESVFLVESRWTDYGGEFATDPVNAVLYPRDRDPLSDDVPESIRRTFGEAVRCYRVHAYDASTLLCRKSLEVLSSELGAEGKTLKAKIASLSGAKRIDPRLVTWAESLRVIGNEAAHRTAEGVSAEDARDVLDFVEAILENVFVLDKKYQAFSERRKARQAEKPGQTDPA